MAPSATTIFATIGMVLVNIIAGLVVLGYKFIAERGISLRVTVAYRFILATFIHVVTTLVTERLLAKPNAEEKKEIKFTRKVFMLSFLCGLFGGSLGSNLYVASLKLSSTTSSTAISNLSPAVTFILAVIFRRETLEFGNWRGRAKIVGTVIVIIGAMTLSFYKGKVIHIWPSKWHLDKLEYALPIGQSNEPQKHGQLIGILLAFATSLSSSISLILQGRLLELYPSRMRVTTLIIGMGAIQSAIFAGIVDRDIYYWRLDFSLAGVVLVYSAIAASVLMMLVTAWCLMKKGSFFVAVFSPTVLVVVAVLSPLVLAEPLYVGSMVGAIIFIFGIYVVIWGTKEDEKKELEQVEEIEENQGPATEEEIELTQVDPHQDEGGEVSSGDGIVEGGEVDAIVEGGEVSSGDEIVEID